MSPRKSASPSRNGSHAYARLEQRLTLLSWLHDLLGYTDTKQLLDDIQEDRVAGRRHHRLQFRQQPGRPRTGCEHGMIGGEFCALTRAHPLHTVAILQELIRSLAGPDFDPDSRGPFRQLAHYPPAFRVAPTRIVEAVCVDPC